VLNQLAGYGPGPDRQDITITMLKTEETLSAEEIAERWGAARCILPRPRVMNGGDPAAVVGWNVSLCIAREEPWTDKGLLVQLHAAASVAGCAAHLRSPWEIEVRGQFSAASGKLNWDLPALMKAHSILFRMLRVVGVTDGVRVSGMSEGASPITVADVLKAQDEGVEARFVPC